VVTIKTAQELALSLENSVSAPHFHRTAYKVNNRIFATLDERENLMCVMLNLIDQDVFCSCDKKTFYPVPNAWGRKGATYVNLHLVNKSMLRDAIQCAYHHIFKSRKRASKNTKD
jgi:hypothetical protein